MFWDYDHLEVPGFGFDSNVLEPPEIFRYPFEAEAAVVVLSKRSDAARVGDPRAEQRDEA